MKENQEKNFSNKVVSCVGQIASYKPEGYYGSTAREYLNFVEKVFSLLVVVSCTCLPQKIVSHEIVPKANRQVLVTKGISRKDYQFFSRL